MGTANQAPSSDLGSLLSGLGISGATLSGGFNADPDDRDLIWEREEGITTGAGFPGTTTRGQLPVIFKESHAEKHIYNIKDDEVAELQRRLWAGGFYPPGTNPDEVALGDRDPYTEKAWLNAIDRAAKFKGAGRDLTIWEVIDMGANLRKEGGLDGDGSGGSGRQPLVTELANPDDLKYYAQRTAVATLGRALRPDEIERFVSSFHNAQSVAQSAAYTAAGASGGQVVGAPSPTVAAETFARQAAPVEASAHDTVKVFDVVSKMLGGRRG
jgi:hypothetical protein